ncbi:MAG: superinfection immunity protein [Zoogloeaceae bacterium]|jgi:arginine exporter protein ArgO|nr:superinfection immunity protein [Zoogloeaceae bacterium]
MKPCPPAENAANFSIEVKRCLWGVAALSFLSAALPFLPEFFLTTLPFIGAFLHSYMPKTVNPISFLTTALFAAMAWVTYLLPGLLALQMRHEKRWTIFLIDAAAGWTLLGWFAALAWCLSRAPSDTDGKNA